jgi:hypothetical protein
MRNHKLLKTKSRVKMHLEQGQSTALQMAHLSRIVAIPQLGYKMVKWIERIEFVTSEKLLGEGEGGINEDDGYFDLLPNI